MHLLKRTADKRKPAPTPSEAEIAVYNYLIAGKASREESRKAVRLLLREASKSLDRRA